MDSVQLTEFITQFCVKKFVKGGGGGKVKVSGNKGGNPSYVRRCNDRRLAKLPIGAKITGTGVRVRWVGGRGGANDPLCCHPNAPQILYHSQTHVTNCIQKGCISNHMITTNSFDSMRSCANQVHVLLPLSAHFIICELKYKCACMHALTKQTPVNSSQDAERLLQLQGTQVSLR